MDKQIGSLSMDDMIKSVAIEADLPIDFTIDLNADPIEVAYEAAQAVYAASTKAISLELAVARGVFDIPKDISAEAAVNPMLAAWNLFWDWVKSIATSISDGIMNMIRRIHIFIANDLSKFKKLYKAYKGKTAEIESSKVLVKTKLTTAFVTSVKNKGKLSYGILNSTIAATTAAMRNEEWITLQSTVKTVKASLRGASVASIKESYSELKATTVTVDKLMDITGIRFSAFPEMANIKKDTLPKIEAAYRANRGANKVISSKLNSRLKNEESTATMTERRQAVTSVNKLITAALSIAMYTISFEIANANKVYTAVTAAIKGIES